MVNRRSDDTFRSARNLQFNRTTRDALGKRDRTDFYKFRAPGQVDFNLALSGLQANASVRLLNSRRALVAVSNRPGNRAEQISATLGSGIYYIQVQFLGRRGTTRYNLRTSATPTPTPPVGDETIATAFDIGVLTTTFSKQETVGTGDPIDFYKFALNDIANLQVRVNGSTAGTKFELIRDGNNNGLVDSGEILASNSSFSANSLASATQDLPQGTYFIKVEPTSTQPTQYQLNLIPTLFGGNVSPEPGNTLPVASDLGVFSGTRSVREYVGTIDTTDIYRFTLNDLSNLQITATASSTPVRVQLVRDANNNGLIDSDEVFVSREGSGVTTPARINEDLPVGTYFVRVDPRFGGNSSTSYEMTLVGNPYGGNGLPDPGNTLSTARSLGTLSGTTSLKEYIGVLDSDDFYRFTLSNAASLQATLTISSTASSSPNNNIRLIQDTNNNGLIDSNEILRSGIASFTPASLTRALQAGTYFLQIEPRFSSFSNNYELTLVTT